MNTLSYFPKDWQEPVEIILVRGLLGGYMPGHFRNLKNRLECDGFKVTIANTKPAGTIADNVQRIRKQLRQENSPLLFLAHSKGGLETLLALGEDADLAKRSRGVLLVQTSRGESPYLQSSLKRCYPYKTLWSSLRERILVTAMKISGAYACCHDLTQNDIQHFIKKN